MPAENADPKAGQSAVVSGMALMMGCMMVLPGMDAIATVSYTHLTLPTKRIV